MKKLTHIATALANNTLSKRDMKDVKGGIDILAGIQTITQIINGVVQTTTITSAVADEKRRERPGGGISTN